MDHSNKPTAKFILILSLAILAPLGFPAGVSDGVEQVSIRSVRDRRLQARGLSSVRHSQSESSLAKGTSLTVAACVRCVGFIPVTSKRLITGRPKPAFSRDDDFRRHPGPKHLKYVFCPYSYLSTQLITFWKAESVEHSPALSASHGFSAMGQHLLGIQRFHTEILLRMDSAE